jgi:hypothetical protein
MTSRLYIMQHPRAGVFTKLWALSLCPWGPVTSGTPQPSGVTQQKEPLVPGSLKEFSLCSFHTNYIIFGHVEIFKKN